MADKIYKNDIGTLFRVDCNTDISDASVRRIIIQRPDKSNVEWSCSLGGTNILEYVTVDGDLNQVGVYKGQAYIETPVGTWRGETFGFKVYDVFR